MKATIIQSHLGLAIVVLAAVATVPRRIIHQTLGMSLKLGFPRGLRPQPDPEDART